LQSEFAQGGFRRRSPRTAGNASNILPLWSRDGLTIVFASSRGGDGDVYTEPVDGSRPAEPWLNRPCDQFPYSISPEGTPLFLEIAPRPGRDLWTLSPDGKRMLLIQRDPESVPRQLNVIPDWSAAAERSAR
jgi:Tol biopolymer transport system component